jgi:hypothetical protein
VPMATSNPTPSCLYNSHKSCNRNIVLWCQFTDKSSIFNHSRRKRRKHHDRPREKSPRFPSPASSGTLESSLQAAGIWKKTNLEKKCIPILKNSKKASSQIPGRRQRWSSRIRLSKAQ